VKLIRQQLKKSFKFQQELSSPLANPLYQSPKRRPEMVKTSEWIGEGWEMVKDDFWNFVLLALIFYAIMSVAGGTGIGVVVLGGPLMCGIFAVILHKMRSKAAMDFGKLSVGFNFFVPALLAYLIISFFKGIAVWFLVIPVFFVGAIYMFVWPLIIEKKLDFWQAMEESRRIVFQDLLAFTWFYFLCSLIIFVGMLVLGIGVLVTGPIALCAQAVAYRDLVGLAEEPSVPETPPSQE